MDVSGNGLLVSVGIALVKPVTPRQWEIYEQRRVRGWTTAAAAREARLSHASAWRREKDRKALAAEARAGFDDRTRHADPLPPAEYGPPARRAVEDFGFFQRRYMGRIATPWQVMAATFVLRLLESPSKEFTVVNAPPGSGKTTLFTHDIPAWLTVRNRAIRGLVGSKTTTGATRYVQRLKRTFEATVPMLSASDVLMDGMARLRSG